MNVAKVFGICLSLMMSCCVWAQTPPDAAAYPTKPIRVIEPFAAGGPTDHAARVIGAKLSEVLGQQVIIDVRAGASGMIGAEMAAHAAPDGYTLFYGTVTTQTLDPALKKKVPYDAVKDFAPISLLLVNPQLLIVNTSLPVKSLKDLIALAKARPGELNYGSGGTGSTPYFGMELLKARTGMNIVHIPYKGLAPALTDMMGGRIMAMFYTMQPTVLSLARAGKIRALAISTAKRSPAAPEIPTIAEAGVPGFAYAGWHALYAPAGTPQAIITKLNAAVVRVLTDPAIAQQFIRQGLEPQPGSPAALAAFMREESERVHKVMQITGMKAQ